MLGSTFFMQVDYLLEIAKTKNPTYIKKGDRVTIKLY